MAIHTDIRSSGKDSGRSGSSRQQLASTPASSFPEKLTLKWRLACRELLGSALGINICGGKKGNRTRQRTKEGFHSVSSKASADSRGSLKLGWLFRIVLS